MPADLHYNFDCLNADRCSPFDKTSILHRHRIVIRILKAL